jgi:hypothetical protein
MNDQKEGHGMTIYRAINSNEPLAIRIFHLTGEASSPDGWYVRLWMDDPDYDLLLTFGPMSRNLAHRLQDLLAKSYCDVWEKWEPPFERDEEEARIRTQVQSSVEEPWYEGEVEVELSGLAMMRQCHRIHLATRGIQSEVEALARETARDAVWSYQGMLDETIEVTVLSPPSHRSPSEPQANASES